MGAAILELTNMLMFRFHYDVIKAEYGDKAKLVFTDMDSLSYSIECEDGYTDRQGDLGKYFDFSAYSKDHPLHNTDKKKVPGFFKDEAVGPDKKKNIKFQTISEFCNQICIHIRAVEKTNSRQRESGNLLLRMKELNLELYKEVLRGKNDHRVTQMGIHSTHHSIYTFKVNKKGLSTYDKKEVDL
jgi:hypothetical protein